MQRYAKNRTGHTSANLTLSNQLRRTTVSALLSLGSITAALVAFAALLANSAPAFGQAEYNFGTATDVWWAQTNGNPTAAPNAGSSSDPTGQSVDGLWNDDLSTGNPSGNQPAGSNPTDNWSTTNAGNPSNPYSTAPATLPGATGNTNVDVVFNAIDAPNSPTDVRINYSPTIQGMYLINPGLANSSLGATSLTADATTAASPDNVPQTITLGGDGLTMTSTIDSASTTQTSSTSTLTIGPTTVGATNYEPLSFALSASQTWANYAHAETIGSAVEALQPVTITGNISVAPTVTGPMVLTFTEPGDSPTNFPQNNHLNDAITDGTNGQLALAFASGQWTFGQVSGGANLGGVNTFSGGILVEPTAQVRAIGPTSAGSNTVVVLSGGTFIPNFEDINSSVAGNQVYSNPFVIVGVGTAQTGANNFQTGALSTMNTNGSGVLNQTITLTGGVTMLGTSIIEGISAPVFYTTNPVNMGSSSSTTLTLVSNCATAAANTKMSDTVEIDSPLEGAGSVAINNTVSTINSVTYYGLTVLAGANTYAGSTTVNNGILQIGNGGTNGSFGNGTQAITFNKHNGNSYLAFDLSSNYNVTNPISFLNTTYLLQGGTYAAPVVGQSQLTTLATAGTTVLNSVSASVGTTVQQINAIVQAGTLELNAYPYGANTPTGTNGLTVTMNGGAFAFGPNYFANDPNPSSLTPLNTYALPYIVAASAQGSLALTSSTSESMDFSPSGFNFQALGLGAVGNVTYTGSFTPPNPGYIFGGGGGTLDFNPSNGITGSASINQNQVGTTILDGNISFNGSVTVSAGNLELDAYDSNLTSSAIFVGPGSSVAVGQTWLSQFLTANMGNTTPISSSFLGLISTGSLGALSLTGSTSENLDLSSADPFGGFATLSLGAIGSVTYSGTLTPNGTTYRLGGGGGTLTFSSTLVDQGSPTALVVANSGTVVLTNSGNQFSGGTTISSGTTLQIDSDTVSTGPGSMAELGQVPSSPNINITFGGGTLRISNSTTLNANRAIALGVSGSPSGTIDVMSGAVVNYAGTIADGFGGAGSLTVTDSGKLVLTGINTYSGGTTIQNGATVQLDMGLGQIGTAGVTLTGGTLALTSSNTTTTLPSGNSISVTNPANVSGETGGVFLTGINSGTIAGPVSVMNSTLLVTGDTGSYTLTLGGTLTVGGGAATVQVNNNGASTGNLIVQGALTASGAPQVTFTGGGNITLQSATTALPIDTQITVGPNTALNSDNATALGTFTQVSVGNGATLNLGAPQTLSSLSGTGTVNLNGNTLTIGNIDASTGSFSGVIANNGPSSAVVVANGSTTLTGLNTYSGGTTVSGGTLRIGNAAGNTPLGSGSLLMSGGSLGLIGGSGTSQTYSTNVSVSANNGVSVTGARSRHS